MAKPRLLDLFCCAGGAGTGYHRAGFDVVGVDINPQPNYPFEFHQAHALEFPVEGFDAIHASPPCQHYTQLAKQARTTASHPDLVAPTRAKLRASGLPYIIENVMRAPLENPIVLCGSSFGLRLQRHRKFESNILLMGLPCRHESMPRDIPIYQRYAWFKSRFVHVYGVRSQSKAADLWEEAMGIDWMSNAELSEAIPPAYTEFLGAQLLRALERAA